MDETRRWTPGNNEMIEDPNGLWVHYHDHAGDLSDKAKEIADLELERDLALDTADKALIDRWQRPLELIKERDYYRKALQDIQHLVANAAMYSSEQAKKLREKTDGS